MATAVVPMEEQMKTTGGPVDESRLQIRYEGKGVDQSYEELVAKPALIDLIHVKCVTWATPKDQPTADWEPYLRCNNKHLYDLSPEQWWKVYAQRAKQAKKNFVTKPPKPGQPTPPIVEKVDGTGPGIKIPYYPRFIWEAVRDGYIAEMSKKGDVPVADPALPTAAVPSVVPPPVAVPLPVPVTLPLPPVPVPVPSIPPIAPASVAVLPAPPAVPVIASGTEVGEARQEEEKKKRKTKELTTPPATPAKKTKHPDEKKKKKHDEEEKEEASEEEKKEHKPKKKKKKDEEEKADKEESSEGEEKEHKKRKKKDKEHKAEAEEADAEEPASKKSKHKKKKEEQDGKKNEVVTPEAQPLKPAAAVPEVEQSKEPNAASVPTPPIISPAPVQEVTTSHVLPQPPAAVAPSSDQPLPQQQPLGEIPIRSSSETVVRCAVTGTLATKALYGYLLKITKSGHANSSPLVQLPSTGDLMGKLEFDPVAMMLVQLALEMVTVGTVPKVVPPKTIEDYRQEGMSNAQALLRRALALPPPETRAPNEFTPFHGLVVLRTSYVETACWIMEDRGLDLPEVETIFKGCTTFDELVDKGCEATRQSRDVVSQAIDNFVLRLLRLG